MPQDACHDVVSIREWLAKESLSATGFRCYGSLERTKKCIERFSTTRRAMAEVYMDRDPLSPRIQTAFSITKVSTYTAGDSEVLIHQLDDPNLEQFSFYDVLKSFTLQGDHWLRVHEVFPEAHIIVLDMKDYALKIVAKINIMFFRDFLMFLLEGMPVRVKQVHMINAPYYYDKLYALVKPVLPAEIRSIIHFHPSTESLHKIVDKKYLPTEYGGEAQSMSDQHRYWVEELEKNRDLYLNNNLWKADLKKRPKDSVVESTMSGSFRTLSID